MEVKPMKILIIEDDISACNEFKKRAKKQNDVEIVATTDSDIEGLKYIKEKEPEGIILDLELNNSSNGNVTSLGLVPELKKLKYNPVVIVTTHVNSERTYEILHRNGVDLIMYKEQANYSCDNVFNTFLTYRHIEPETPAIIDVEEENKEDRISKYINRELDLIGIPTKMKGRSYIHDAVIYIIMHEKEDDVNVIRYMTKKHQRSESTITNGIQNAISHAWGKSSIEDLEKYYTLTVNYKTGEPTPMELVYYYAEKIKKEL